MASRSAKFADAVTTDVNSSGLLSPENATAVRVELPEHTPKELKVMKVQVVPRPMTTDRLTRSQLQHNLEVDVAVQKKVDHGNLVQADAIRELSEGLAEHLAGKVLTSSDSQKAVVKKVRHDIGLHPKHLKEQAVATSVITLEIITTT